LLHANTIFKVKSRWQINAAGLIHIIDVPLGEFVIRIYQMNMLG